jgi:hypothetical protein
MATELNPGDFSSDQIDYSAFDGSMADFVDRELDRLMQLDGLTGLSFDTNDRDVRARRRLFVAIARGVLVYLHQNADAVDVPILGNVTVHPTINVTGQP